jgi:hypothetical protein
MWAAITVMWAVALVMRGSRSCPTGSGSSSCLISLLPLLFHPHHLRSEWLPVAFWNRRVVDFLDDVGEVFVVIPLPVE